MNQKRISRAEWDKFFAENGIKPVQADHPIYSEGPSITLLSRTQKQSGQKDIVSLPIDSQSNTVQPVNPPGPAMKKAAEAYEHQNMKLAKGD